jgi:aspartate/methionine/tyrosine aminotransferase
VLLFVSPSNPTGAVYTTDEIRAIGRWVEDHQLWALTDDLRAPRLRRRRDGLDARALPVPRRQRVVNGVARPIRMTGWRVGWMIGPPIWSRPRQPQSHATSNVANVSQRRRWPPSGDLRGREMKTAFDRRRKTIVSMLNEIEGVVCPMPEGVLRLPSVKGLLGGHGWRRRRPHHRTSAELAEYISTPPRWPWSREAFGSPGYLRLSYASATTTWSRGSPACRSSSLEGARED